MFFSNKPLVYVTNEYVMHSIKLWFTVSIMFLWAKKCWTPFLKVEKSVVGFCIFVYQVKTYAFLVNELRCWESCWLSAQKKIDCIRPPISTLYTIIWTHWTPFKVVRPFKVRLETAYGLRYASWIRNSPWNSTKWMVFVRTDKPNKTNQLAAWWQLCHHATFFYSRLIQWMEVVSPI